MKITTALGDSYEAKEMYVEMVRTFVVKVYFDVGSLPNEMPEEELEEIAHEDWLEACAQILEMVSKGFPYIDLEFLGTNHIEVKVIE